MGSGEASSITTCVSLVVNNTLLGEHTRNRKSFTISSRFIFVMRAQRESVYKLTISRVDRSIGR